MLLISLNVSLLPWVKDKSERSSEKKIWEQFWGNWGAVQNFGSCYFWVQGGGKICWKIAERLEKLWKPWEISPLCLYHTLGFESRLLWRPNTCETVMFPTTNSVEWNGICPWLEPKMRSFVQLTSFFAFGGLSSFDDLWLEGPQIITHAPWEYAPPPSCLPKPIEAANLDFHPGVLGWVLLNEKLSLFKHRCRSNAIWHPSFQIWNAFAQGVEWFTSFQENCDKLRKISEILSLEFFLILCWTLIFFDLFWTCVCVCVCFFLTAMNPIIMLVLFCAFKCGCFFSSGGQSGAGKRCDVPTTVHWRLSVRLHVHSGEGQRAAACCTAGSTEQWRHLIVVPLGPFRCLS